MLKSVLSSMVLLFDTEGEMWECRVGKRSSPSTHILSEYTNAETGRKAPLTLDVTLVSSVSCGSVSCRSPSEN